mgnify:FL=1
MNCYIKSLLITLLSSLTILFIKEYIIINYSTNNFAFYFMNYLCVVIIAIPFLYFFKLKNKLRNIYEVLISFKNTIFILYSLIIYYLVFSLDIIISDIIFMFSSDLSFKTNINYYITSYINTLKYRFNDNINILDKMELIKFIIWNIIVFVYIVFNFLKTKYDSKNL